MQSKKTTLLLIKILERIISDKTTHSSWLNTLSFLEYIGTRKMLKSLPAHSLNETLLEHINEESRHSLFFKRLAKKVSGKDLSFHEHEMLCSKQAESYFQQIDQKSKTLSRSNTILNYLYTTYIVELRATLVYSIYNKILERNDFPFTVNCILKEEEKHLETVMYSIKKLDPFSEQNFEEIKEYEHQIYFTLLRNLEEEVFKHSQSNTVKVQTLSKNHQPLYPQEQHP